MGRCYRFCIISCFLVFKDIYSYNSFGVSVDSFVFLCLNNEEDIGDYV